MWTPLGTLVWLLLFEDAVKINEFIHIPARKTKKIKLDEEKLCGMPTTCIICIYRWLFPMVELKEIEQWTYYTQTI